MFEWFRDRVKNQRPWFRTDSYQGSMEGIKQKDGTLEIVVSTPEHKYRVRLNKETATKLSEWMGRTYPSRGNNVIQFPMARPVSISTTQRNTEGNPGPTGSPVE